MLRPGVEGLSETIRVRSIVGRFLEHSRIYSFEAGDTASIYFGSGDLMPRNLDRRIEVLAPVEGARARAEVNAILDSAFSDTTNAWELGQDGVWTRVAGKEKNGHSHQAAMMRRAQLRARRARS
jgi:polyphosphate kinase